MRRSTAVVAAVVVLAVRRAKTVTDFQLWKGDGRRQPSPATFGGEGRANEYPSAFLRRRDLAAEKNSTRPTTSATRSSTPDSGRSCITPFSGVAGVVLGRKVAKYDLGHPFRPA